MLDERNAAAIGQDHRHGLRQAAGTALAKARHMRHNVVHHGINKAGKLGFQKHRAAVERQSNRNARRAVFVQRRIDKAACRKHVREGDIVDGDLCAVAFEPKGREEVFVDAHVAKDPTNRADIFTEIDGLRIKAKNVMQRDAIGVAAVDVLDEVRLQPRAVGLVRDAIRLFHRWRSNQGQRACDQAGAMPALLRGIAKVAMGVDGRADLLLQLRVEGAVLGV